MWLTEKTGPKEESQNDVRRLWSASGHQKGPLYNSILGSPTRQESTRQANFLPGKSRQPCFLGSKRMKMLPKFFGSLPGSCQNVWQAAAGPTSASINGGIEGELERWTKSGLIVEELPKILGCRDFPARKSEAEGTFRGGKEGDRSGLYRVCRETSPYSGGIFCYTTVQEEGRERRTSAEKDRRKERSSFLFPEKTYLDIQNVWKKSLVRQKDAGSTGIGTFLVGLVALLKVLELCVFFWKH